MRHLVVVSCVALCMAALSATAHAGDTWTDPYPGVRLLHRVTGNQDIHVLKVDLCAAGVSVRTTASGERGQTPGGFGSAVGAAFAVNGDFFTSGYGTDGMAAHGGALWGGSDHGYVGPLAFGDHRVELRPHEDQTGFEPWMQEVVSGHPTVLWQGQRRDNNGDPLCSNRNPRTMVGLSADKRTLFIAVADGRTSTRIGLTCDEEAALMSEMGATMAMNLDGGGSSAMWQAGVGTLNHPSDGSPRVVGNHLAVMAGGGDAPPFCPDHFPRGYLDDAQCEAVAGWAQDQDQPDQAIPVHVYFDGTPGQDGAIAVATTANIERQDLCDAIGSCAHGFSLPVPGALRDGQPHTVNAYGIDAEGIDNPALMGGGKTVTCQVPTPTIPATAGARRHVTSADVLGAWGLHFYDVVTLPDDQVDAYADGADLDGPPQLVQADGDPAIYLVDGTLLRHVTSQDSMAAWHFTADEVKSITQDELASYTMGAPLPDAPFVLRGSGPAVYVLDVLDPSNPDSTGGQGDGDGDGHGGKDGDLGSGCQSSTGGAGAAWALMLLALMGLARRRRSMSGRRQMTDHTS